ncbi:uncharacterized protein SOCEGT47_032510 [Sorangium cellulosum]|uniref:Uncharacterized protein n=1 Tax=Sorangium cellulosum TaxID=56 RepID=A0A4P2Q0L1_SORCE|nr:hypothetical protein [Sorangium cellulosum]AUX22744.1 uncharacterized protein SOCEGT47_032510 [Sorangium cellulosum]
MVERELRGVDEGRRRFGEGHVARAHAPGSRGAPSGWASGDDSGLIDLNALRRAGEAEAEGPVMIPVPHIQVFPFGAPEETPRAAQAPAAAAPPPRRSSRMGNALPMMLGAALTLAAVGVGYAAASLRAEAPAPSATASLVSE